MSEIAERVTAIIVDKLGVNEAEVKPEAKPEAAKTAEKIVREELAKLLK